MAVAVSSEGITHCAMNDLHSMISPVLRYTVMKLYYFPQICISIFKIKMIKTFFLALGLKPRDLHTLGKCSTSELYPQLVACFSNLRD